MHVLPLDKVRVRLLEATTIRRIIDPLPRSLLIGREMVAYLTIDR